MNVSVSTNSTETTTQSIFDWAKWMVVVVLVGGGIFANWYYQDQSLLNRVLGLVAVAVVAALIALQTERGRAIWTLLKEARTEIRRVVWPTRQETTQTTMIVVGLVLAFSMVLWGLDSLLSWVVAAAIG